MATNVADNILEWIFLNENDRIPFQISLNFVTRSPINTKPNRWQAITCTTDDPAHWCIYASLGGDELNKRKF